MLPLSQDCVYIQLNPFPTRRSSDLDAALSVKLPGLEELSASRATSPSPTIFFQDRKSTRLNSSHLGISYAVFCLKKKTILTAFLPAIGIMRYVRALRAHGAGVAHTC